MTMIKTVTAAAIALGAIAAAAPASAVVTTFAQFQAIGTKGQTYWKNDLSGSLGTGGSIYTTNTPTSTTPGSRLVSFSLVQPSIAPYVTNVNATYTLLASVTNTPAQLSSGFLIQPGIAGSFSFKSNTAITIGSTTYAAGSNLLSGTFTQAAIFGPRLGTAGSFSSSTTSGATITYTSDFLSFAPSVDRDFSISLTSIASALQAVPTNGNPTRALRTFRAFSTGSFSSDPAPIVTAVPEPAVWGLMIVGFGMVGLQTRRRNNASVAA